MAGSTSLHPGPGTSKWPGHIIHLSRRVLARLGQIRIDKGVERIFSVLSSADCWSNPMTRLGFSPRPSPYSSFPGPFRTYLSTVFFYGSSCLLNPLSLPLLLFPLPPGLCLALFLLSPNLVVFLPGSPVGHPSVRSGTRVQLWLRRRQLLPCHRRPSHRPSSEALGDLDVRTAQTRALLYRQPLAGEAGLAGERTVGCSLLLADPGDCTACCQSG